MAELSFPHGTLLVVHSAAGGGVCCRIFGVFRVSAGTCLLWGRLVGGAARKRSHLEYPDPEGHVL